MARPPAYETESLGYQAYRRQDYLAALRLGLAALAQHATPPLLIYLIESCYLLQALDQARLLARYALTLFPQEEKFSYAWQQLCHISSAPSALPPDIGQSLAQLLPSAGERPRVSVCMIVRDEEQVLLECLASVATLADELIIVDTGSQDRTVELARQFSPNVRLFHYPWHDHFSAARNFSIEQASGDWILAIDADERLSVGSLDYLNQFLSWNPVGTNIFSCRLHNLREDGTLHSLAWVIRILPRRPNLRYHGMIHNLPYQTDSNFPPPCIRLDQVIFHHIGYQRAIIAAKQKNQRVALLEKSMQLPEYDTPYIHYKYAHSLMYQQASPDFTKALAELEYSYAETLRHRDHPPAPTWAAATLEMVCLYIFRILDHQQQYQQMVERFPAYQAFCPYSELRYIYARALLKVGQFQLAKAAAAECFNPSLTHLQPGRGFQDWKPLALLLHLAVEADDSWAAIAYSLQLLQFFPSGPVGGTDVRQLLERLLAWQELSEAEFIHRLGNRIGAALQQRAYAQVIEEASWLLPLRLDADIAYFLLLALLHQQDRQLYAVVRRYCHVVFPQAQQFKSLPATLPSGKSSDPPAPGRQILLKLFSGDPPARVSVCMIVKDEAAQILDCLRSVSALASEIILVDTGSTDETVALARQFSERVKIYHYAWDDNFSAARNLALEKATGEWILSIDADERLDPASLDFLRPFFAYHPVGLQAFAVCVYSRYDTRCQDTLDTIPRIFPRNPRLRFTGLIHNQLYRTDGPLALLSLDTVWFWHSGYQQKAIQSQRKRERLPLLRQSLQSSEHNTPFAHYQYAYSLLYQQAEPDYAQALAELEYSLAETLRWQDAPPFSTWLPAPLGFVCLHIFRILIHQQRYQEMLERYSRYRHYSSYVEIVFLYGNALLETGDSLAARATFQDCLAGGYRIAQPRAGFHSWKPLMLLLYLALQAGETEPAISYCYRLLELFPDGQVPGHGNIQDVLAKLCARQGFLRAGAFQART